VVVYDFQDPFFGSTIEQLQSTAHDQGYSLVLTGFQGRHPEGSDLTPLHKHTIDGLVVLGSSDQSEWLDSFRHLPVVRVGHGISTEQCVCVSIDEADAAEQLLQHIASRGSDRCVFIGSNLYVHDLRSQALEAAAKSLGMPLQKMITSSRGFGAGFQITNTLLSETASPPALVCATDIIAMGALHALNDAGLRWPVTGFDDIPAAAQFIPSITTIQQPIEALIERAFRAVMAPDTPSEILLKGRLVVRSST
jgi:LacI family transcriptional regulator